MSLNDDAIHAMAAHNGVEIDICHDMHHVARAFQVRSAEILSAAFRNAAESAYLIGLMQKDHDKAVAEITKQRDDLLAAIKTTLEENGHLADGDECTLIALKRAWESVTGNKL
jgi:hypothetical protein